MFHFVKMVKKNCWRPSADILFRRKLLHFEDRWIVLTDELLEVILDLRCQKEDEMAEE